MSETPVKAPESAEEPSEGGIETPAAEDLVCDFCGETTPTVRRIALDGEYDRLQKPHRTRYACPSCSQRKERERGGPREAAGS